MFKCMEQLDSHKKSKNHKKNAKAYLAQNDGSKTVEEMMSSMFQNISVDKNSSRLDQSDEESHDSEKLLDKLEKDHQEQLNSSAHTHNKQNKPTALSSLRICLFCNKDHDGVKKCLDHMSYAHSFFILDIDCLINLKGLLSYLAGGFIWAISACFAVEPSKMGEGASNI
eukprot:CAMPEP_0202956298 /NCGR_PEP_ID=MMETSP1396-20130829/800_1 /ASSEMBLY_ACC=CAM_ASM_000872 /TAXON_ID= /ORGANISM="Pseudokeronopsis sp., Strain Brazil" /LENGTH=168 /DNA_ID=CAMNT_0049673235 /DNA_START=251 /DNA_END=758 /DNA_ORIENTATION=+